MFICQSCGCKSIGPPMGDNICYECANGGLFGKASKAALLAVENLHFEKTGEQKSGNEILRELLF